jgi:hypothetical protein
VAPAVTGPGGAVAETVAGALSGLASQIGQLADRAADAEGRLEGAREGLDPEFRPRRNNTVSGRAYDEAGLRSMSLRTNSALRSELATAFETAKGDVRKFQDAATALRAKYVEATPDEIRPSLEADFETMRFGYDREFVRLADAAEAEQLAAEAMGLLDGRVKDIGRTAFMGGLDGAADTVLEMEINALTADTLAYGPKTAFTFRGVEYAADPSRAGVLSLPQIEETLQKTGSQVGINRVKGAFGRTKGLGAKQKFLGGFLEDYGAGKGVAGTMSLDEVEGLEREMLQEIRALEAEQRAAQAALRSRVTEVRANLREYRGYAKDGLVPPPEELQRLEAEAIATGDGDLVREVRQMAQLTSLARLAVQSSPVELANEINARRAAANETGVLPEEAAEISVLESTLSGMRTGLAQDARGYAERAGLVAPIPLQPGEGLILSLQARAGQARLIEQRYGVKGAIFTQAEMDQIQATDKAGGTEIIELAAGIVQTTGADAGDVLAKISGRAPLIGHLGGLILTGGSRDAVNAAAQGRKLMAEAGGVSSGLSSTTSGETARATLSGAFAAHPDARRTIEETANAIYVGRKGMNTEYDAAAYKRALQEASGAVFTGGQQYGGIARTGAGWWDGRQTREVAVPSWLRADLADEAFSALSAEDYAYGGRGAPLHGDGSAVDLKTLKGAALVSVAPGVYRLALGDPDGDDPRYLRGAGEGGFYELDLDRVREQIAQKLPQAVGP